MSRARRDIDERLLRKAVDASASSIVIADARRKDLPLIFVNPAFRALTGYSPKEILGRNCRFLQSSDRSQPGIAVIRKALRERRSCTVVLRNYKKNGVLFWNELRLSPVLGPGGELTHYIGVQTDVTERVRAEEASREHEQELRRTVRERTRDLESKNIALREVLGQLELEKRSLQEKITANVDSLLVPLLVRLSRRCPPELRPGLSTLDKALRDLTSPFGQTLTRRLYRLTPRQIEIALLVRQGLSTKDICSHLGLSVSTVENQRNTLRRKLGLSGKDANLSSYLRQLGSS